jgi:hypothetical protein
MPRISSRVVGSRVTYKTISGLDDRIYWHLIETNRNYRQLQLYRWSTHITVRSYICTGIPSLTSCILETDL